VREEGDCLFEVIGALVVEVDVAGALQRLPMASPVRLVIRQMSQRPTTLCRTASSLAGAVDRSVSFDQTSRHVCGGDFDLQLEPSWLWEQRLANLYYY
jgi:hypothetical protein